MITQILPAVPTPEKNNAIQSVTAVCGKWFTVKNSARSVASRMSMCYGVGDGVALGFGVDVGVGLLAGVTVALGVTVTVACGFAVGRVVGRVVAAGLGVTGATGGNVGLIKITRIAPSSGTGDTTFLPVTNTPIIMTTRTIPPTTMVNAAIVFFRSSIRI